MENGNFVTLPSASKILNVSYQTILNNKAEYGAVEIDAPGRVQYAIPARFVREFLEEQFQELQGRIELFNNQEYADPFEVYRHHDTGEREEDMLRLRFEELWTLQEIGDKYEISRERVRQIIGNSGRGYKPKRIRKQARAMNDKTNGEVAEELDISYGLASKLRADIRTPVDGNGTLSLGFLMEEWAAEHLEGMGFDTKLMPNMHPFDMLVNGDCRIDVKYSSEPRDPPSSRNVSPQWVFSVRGKRDNCDLYMCITGEDDVFMIPSADVPQKQTQIIFCYPTKRPTLGKFQKFHDRYDLIHNFCKEHTNGHR